MANVNKNNTINYIELPMVKNAETKKFYHQAFEWEFTDWGPDYISFSGANIDGGFNGMGILKPIYEFPGGKRFHFLDPKWNELAIWSE